VTVALVTDPGIEDFQDIVDVVSGLSQVKSFGHLPVGLLEVVSVLCIDPTHKSFWEGIMGVKRKLKCYLCFARFLRQLRDGHSVRYVGHIPDTPHANESKQMPFLAVKQLFYLSEYVFSTCK
jgi:hypothetical protein